MLSGGRRLAREEDRLGLALEYSGRDLRPPVRGTVGQGLHRIPGEWVFRLEEPGTDRARPPTCTRVSSSPNFKGPR